METFLIELESDYVASIRSAVLEKCEKIKNDFINNRIVDRDKEYFECVIDSMTRLASQLYSIGNECVPSVNVVEIYCNLALSNRKSKCQDLLNAIWCSMSKSQQEECLKEIKK